MELLVDEQVAIKLQSRWVFGVLHCVYQGQIIVFTSSSSFVLLESKVEYCKALEQCCKRSTAWFTHKRPLLTDNHPDSISETYWTKRYLLFSKFDCGVQLDFESWYSVTPECIAQHIAKRLSNKNSTVLDVCAGAGGNAIQFALQKHHVIACEISCERIQMAQNNAGVYGVSNCIEFVCCDGLEMLRTMQSNQVDYVFLSPPWGGPGYQTSDAFSLKDNVILNGGGNGIDLFHESVRVAKYGVLYYLPKNTKLVHMLQELGVMPCQEFETHKLNNREHSICGYFGNGF